MRSSQVPLISFEAVKHSIVGSVHYPPGSSFGPRVQPDFQLVLLHTGSMEVVIDERPHRIEPGHAVLLTPGHQEFFSFAKDQATWHRWIAIHCKPLPAEALLEIEALPVCLPIPEALNRLTDLMMTTRSTYDKDSDVMCSLGIAALQIYAAAAAPSNPGQAFHPSVRAAITAIESHYHEELSLDRLARMSGVTAEHLVRLFRKEMQTTPIKYVWDYRTMRAIELLTHTGLSIAEIASECGFKTTFHLARIVKRSVGKTATEIRANNGSVRSK